MEITSFASGLGRDTGCRLVSFTGAVWVGLVRSTRGITVSVSDSFRVLEFEFITICFPNDILWSLKHLRTQIDYIHEVSEYILVFYWLKLNRVEATRSAGAGDLFFNMLWPKCVYFCPVLTHFQCIYDQMCVFTSK